MKKIACIIVTYNRKDLLMNCIHSVLSQSYQPDTVYIVDNASTDGTYDLLVENEFTNEQHKKIINGISVKYIQLPSNIGGAGGFYTGMKTAHETNSFDGFWVMDDDGEPDEKCLENLVPYMEKHQYIAPLVIDIHDESKISFDYHGELDVNQVIKSQKDSIIRDYACPFNGILYTKKLVDKIGYPKKEMFIWGDEENYAMRCVDNGFPPITVVNAVHRHPANRVLTDMSLFGKIDVAPQMWRCYCRYRNMAYNWRDKTSFWGRMYIRINHIYYYLIKKRSIKWTRCFIDAYSAGLRGDFTGLSKYIKQ